MAEPTRSFLGRMARFVLTPRLEEVRMGVSYSCNLLRRFESHLADLYELYSSELAEDPEVSSLFARLALEERSHALEAGFQAHILEAEPRAFEGVNLDADELLVATAMVRSACSAAHGVHRDEALRRAVELESSAADYHRRMAVRQANRGFGEFLAHLGRDDADHRSRLMRYAERRLRPQAT